MRILFCGDSPTVTTGFGIVSKNLLTRWSDMGHKIGVLGINYYGDPYDHTEFKFPIWPVDKGSMDSMYGYNKLWLIEEAFKPDIIFFLNDPWVIASYLSSRPVTERTEYQKIIAYYPTDGGPIKPEWLKILNELDAQICYSNFAERVIIESNDGVRPPNLYQVYHGVDTSVFRPMNQSLARETLNLPQDSFIVGMVARNQYRKRFDILVQGFAEFAEDKPEAKLYLHTVLKDVGFDIYDLCRQYKLSNKLILTEDLNPAKGVPDTVLNLIYNSFDINCLISLGDGFGLPVAESMATGCPQVVSGHSCLQELVENHGGLTVKTAAWIMHTQGINTWGGVSDYKDLASKLNILYKNKPLRLEMAQQASDFIHQEKFTWDYSAREMDNIFKKLFHLVGPLVDEEPVPTLKFS